MIPQFYYLITIRINRSSDTSTPNFMGGSVGSIHICIPKFWHWFEFISDFSILFPNHKPCPNSSISTSAESSVNGLTTVQIVVLTCSLYSGSNGDTFPSSEVNDICQKFAPKQWIPALLSISVVDALQITLSWFLCTLLITQ